MITKDKKIEKICSFYASDYHLEMIMIPYIDRKIGQEANIEILTERDLTETVNNVISRINLSKKRKQEIININWENKKLEDIKLSDWSDESIFFVIGSIDYMNKINKQIEDIKSEMNTIIINCYSIDEVQNSITDIVLSHSKVLNTMEEKEIK